MKGRGPQVLGYRMGKGRGQYKEQAQFLKKHQRGIGKGARQVVVRKSCAMGWGTESEASKERRRRKSLPESWRKAGRKAWILGETVRS